MIPTARPARPQLTLARSVAVAGVLVRVALAVAGLTTRCDDLALVELPVRVAGRLGRVERDVVAIRVAIDHRLARDLRHHQRLVRPVGAEEEAEDEQQGEERGGAGRRPSDDLQEGFAALVRSHQALVVDVTHDVARPREHLRGQVAGGDDHDGQRRQDRQIAVDDEQDAHEHQERRGRHRDGRDVVLHRRDVVGLELLTSVLVGVLVGGARRQAEHLPAIGHQVRDRTADQAGTVCGVEEVPDPPDELEAPITDGRHQAPQDDEADRDHQAPGRERSAAEGPQADREDGRDAGDDQQDHRPDADDRGRARDDEGEDHDHRRDRPPDPAVLDALEALPPDRTDTRGDHVVEPVPEREPGLLDGRQVLPPLATEHALERVEVVERELDGGLVAEDVHPVGPGVDPDRRAALELPLAHLEPVDGPLGVDVRVAHVAGDRLDRALAVLEVLQQPEDGVDVVGGGPLVPGQVDEQDALVEPEAPALGGGDPHQPHPALLALLALELQLLDRRRLGGIGGRSVLLLVVLLVVLVSHVITVRVGVEDAEQVAEGSGDLALEELLLDLEVVGIDLALLDLVVQHRRHLPDGRRQKEGEGPDGLLEALEALRDGQVLEVGSEGRRDDVLEQPGRPDVGPSQAVQDTGAGQVLREVDLLEPLEELCLRDGFPRLAQERVQAGGLVTVGGHWLTFTRYKNGKRRWVFLFR